MKQDHDKGVILVIDDDPVNLKVIVDLILLDIMMPDIDGYEVCRQLKKDESVKNIPVIFLSALNDVSAKVKGFKIGAVDYISKPFQIQEVLARVKTHLLLQTQQQLLSTKNTELKIKNKLIEEQASKLETMVRKDFLTGISNRRDFLEKSKIEENRFYRTQKKFSIVMIDIDKFKTVNDTFGHECGDNVLIAVSQELTKVLRKHDIVARWGGEEFICLLVDTEVDSARIVSEKIRKTMENYQYRYGDTPFSVTVTIGVCLFDGSFSIEECIRRADKALYEGKEMGRNQVVIS